MFCNRFFNSNKRFAKVAGIGYLWLLMNIRFSYLLVSLVITLGLVSCGIKSGEQLNQDANKAWDLMRGGDQAESLKMLLHLADDYHRAGDLSQESVTLFCAAQVYFEQRDTVGMRSVLSRMEALAKTHPEHPNLVYSYHTVLQALYSVIYEENGRDEDRDAMLSEGAAAIALMEKMSVEQLAVYRVNPLWNYYNMAVAYDMYFDPPVRDSIEYYLDKARATRNLNYQFAENVRLEGDISIGDEQAWLYYYDGEYEKAERQMFYVLSLIDSALVKTPNSVLTEKGEAYAFLVELYSNTGRPDEALEYQKLKNGNDLVRLGAERNEALHKVEAQYNVAKAEAKVVRLRALLIISGGMILLLAMLVLNLQLWRRNRTQMQYSAAVEALVDTDEQVRALTGNVPTDRAREIFASADKPLSAVERKYILLFMSGKTTEEIADAMHVAPASVYTMKYRIRKKFPDTFPLPF